MGYCHYFRQKKSATKKQWGDIIKTFSELRTYSLLCGPAFCIQYEYDDPSPPQIDDEYIIFNGVEDAGHETMILVRKLLRVQGATHNSASCKTMEKPYDFAVMVLLLLCDHFAPAAWFIESDGDSTDWAPVIDWVNNSGLVTVTLPKGIDNAF